VECARARGSIDRIVATASPDYRRVRRAETISRQLLQRAIKSAILVTDGVGLEDRTAHFMLHP
jgi:hypothetical protein